MTAVSVTRAIGETSDGSPVTCTDYAVCIKCAGWATRALSWGSSFGELGFATERRISQFTTEVRFACDEHWSDVLHELSDERGYAIGHYYPSDLAVKVSESSKARR